MNDKDKNNKKDIRKDFNEEFRTVRFYSNIDGIEKEYGYDYNRDANGKENYREIGEIPEEFGKDFVDRILNLEKSFEWDNGFFSRSMERLTNIFPSFERMFGEFGSPRLTSGKERERIPIEQESSGKYQVAYDMQVDKENSQMYLIVELPGFSKDQVKLKLIKNQLYLVAENDKKNIDTKIPIEYLVNKEEKIKATMKHGILEVKLKLLEKSNGEEAEDIPIN